jgi:hypothetical protein
MSWPTEACSLRSGGGRGAAWEIGGEPKSSELKLTLASPWPNAKPLDSLRAANSSTRRQFRGPGIDLTVIRRDSKLLRYYITGGSTGTRAVSPTVGR